MTISIYEEIEKLHAECSLMEKAAGGASFAGKMAKTKRSCVSVWSILKK